MPGGLFHLALTQGQAPATQGDPPQQRAEPISLATQQLLHLVQQALRPVGRPALLQQLRMVQFQQRFEHQ